MQHNEGRRGEIADGAPRLAYNRRDLPQLSVSSIRSEGKRGRPPWKNTASDRSTEENKTSDGESSVPSNLEEIIALFRRIQSSISKEGHVSTKKSSSNNAKVKQSLESVVNVLHKSPARKQAKGPLKGGDEILPQRTGAPKREARPKENSPGADLQLSRLPSSFVKRSPIPVPYTPKEKISEVQGEGSPITVAVKDMELQRVDELKLIELKELAKSKGLKGYSKLKKGELVEQLKGAKVYDLFFKLM
ncbi:Rho termination factor [Cinnamomum micranthum f. kanehirae]|uniref:Rho termination factor n=1 Tax=Cinnamomum micranthum f. kanehirae TaxID=337451 RepID=A0A443PZY8_9MAGN|nr:Rho termination factor [Cinnamomum micranthum f. kanehirae]